MASFINADMVRPCQHNMPMHVPRLILGLNYTGQRIKPTNNLTVVFVLCINISCSKRMNERQQDECDTCIGLTFEIDSDPVQPEDNNIEEQWCDSSSSKTTPVQNSRQNMVIHNTIIDKPFKMHYYTWWNSHQYENNGFLNHKRRPFSLTKANILLQLLVVLQVELFYIKWCRWS